MNSKELVEQQKQDLVRSEQGSPSPVGSMQIRPVNGVAGPGDLIHEEGIEASQPVADQSQEIRLQKNLSWLKDNLKFLGFGEDIWHSQQLDLLMTKQVTEFQLYSEEYYDEDSKLETRLHFRRSAKNGWYYFNKYDALLRLGGDPEADRLHTFYVDEGKCITCKEAYNLLQGRAVYRRNLVTVEGQYFNAWILLNLSDSKTDHGNYKSRYFGDRFGYDLEKLLSIYPIRELTDQESKVKLIRSLERGNLQLVTFDKSAKSEQLYIEASPATRSINIYSIATLQGMKSGRRAENQESVPLGAEEDREEELADIPVQVQEKGASRKGARKLR